MSADVFDLKEASAAVLPGVDHKRRRQLIADIIWRIAADEGIGAVSVRRLASEIRASTTVITYEFANREEMMRFAYGRRLAQWQELGDRIARSKADARHRLRALILEQCPLTETGLQDTRVWLATIASPTPHGFGQEHNAEYTRWLQNTVLDLLREIGADPELVSPLMAAVWGLSAAAAENPTAWPPSRVETTVDSILAGAGLLDDARTGSGSKGATGRQARVPGPPHSPRRASDNA